jgi:hypothetical protein
MRSFWVGIIHLHLQVIIRHGPTPSNE